MIKTAMRYGLLLRRPLSHLASDLNRVSPRVKESSLFATLAALRFDDTKGVEYISAGHVPLLHFRQKSNDVISHYAQQFPLGLLACDGCVRGRIRFDPAEIFLLPTVGAVDLGEERTPTPDTKFWPKPCASFHKHPLAEILGILRSVLAGLAAGLADD